MHRWFCCGLCEGNGCLYFRSYLCSYGVASLVDAGRFYCTDEFHGSMPYRQKPHRNVRTPSGKNPDSRCSSQRNLKFCITALLQVLLYVAVDCRLQPIDLVCSGFHCSDIAGGIVCQFSKADIFHLLILQHFCNAVCH